MADDEWNMRWGNILTSLNWQNEISSKLNSRIIVYWSGSRSKLDYNSFFDSQEPTYKEYPASWTNSGKLLTNRNKMDDLGITADFSWIANKSHHLRFGVDYIWHYTGLNIPIMSIIERTHS